MNITIPRVLSQVSTEEISRSFAIKKIGTVTAIHRFDRVNERGHAYWFAFITITPMNTSNSRAFVQLLKTGKQVFVVYKMLSAWTFNEFSTRSSSAPFIEVHMHVRDLVLHNPVVAAKHPVAVKKGIVAKNAKRQILDNDGWITVGSVEALPVPVADVPFVDVTVQIEVPLIKFSILHPDLCVDAPKPLIQQSMHEFWDFPESDQDDMDILLKEINQYRNMHYWSL